MSHEPVQRKRKARTSRHPVCDRKRPIKVWVTDEQRAEIDRRVKLSGLSQSAYLRTAGLNHPIQSMLDYDAVTLLAKVCGDLGRLGQQLKAWLTERPGAGASVAEVQRVLAETRAIQDEARNCMGHVRRL